MAYAGHLLCGCPVTFEVLLGARMKNFLAMFTGATLLVVSSSHSDNSYLFSSFTIYGTLLFALGLIEALNALEQDTNCLFKRRGQR